MYMHIHLLSAQHLTRVHQNTLLVDKQMNHRHHNFKFQSQVFYGQLLNIYEVPLPAEPVLTLGSPIIWILACIQLCPITPGHIPGTISYLSQRHNTAPIKVIDAALIPVVVG